jgi:hypothetical protein
MAARRLIAFTTALISGAAAADGAFPASFAPLLPADRPHEIGVATNFGLVISDDDGATWSWVCEEAIGAGVTQYLLGPDDALYGVFPEGLSVSNDTGCTWSTFHAALLDAFVDPNDARHVLAEATIEADGGGDRSALFESHDGAKTFGAPLYVMDKYWALNGVELARSAPGTFFLTAYFNDFITADFRTALIQGGSFDTVALTPVTGPRSVRIAAVDRNDARRVYLRVSSLDGTDALGVATDAGQALQLTLSLSMPMTAFLQRADAGILIGTADGGLFTSSDLGQTFSALSVAPHILGLAERGSRLYATTDQLLDGYALATSDDDGAHWTPRFRFDQIQGPLACQAATCAQPWRVLFPRIKPGQTLDAGMPPPPPPPKGCGCAQSGGALLLALLLLHRAGHRRRGVARVDDSRVERDLPAGLG